MFHFNYVAIADETDREVMGTRACRKWNREGESVKSVINAMNVAQYADQTVITGDTLDYLSQGTIMLTQKHILSRDKDIMIALGGHEWSKQVQTNLHDETPFEERLETLRQIWPHDMFYYAKGVGEKVIAICLDNSQGRFLPCQIAQLEADIRRAKEEGKIILIFMHEPIAPRDNAGEIPALWASKGAHKEFDFGDETTIGNVFEDEATEKIYSLITENADVIKGLFCGHRHSMFYVEVKASYVDGGGVHEATIPQLVAPGNPYLDHVGRVVRIIVK